MPLMARHLNRRAGRAMRSASLRGVAAWAMVTAGPVLLLLKIVLVPALVVFVTLGGRRWGPRVGGFLTSFPIVAGPTLFFYATEQGTAFARDAARATLVALVGVAASGLVYAWASLRLRWWASLVASWASFVVTTLGLNALGW